MIQPHFDLQIGLWCKFSLELYDNFFIIIPRKISIIGHFLFNFITWLHKSYPWDHVPWKKSSSFKYFFSPFFHFLLNFCFQTWDFHSFGLTFCSSTPSWDYHFGIFLLEILKALFYNLLIFHHTEPYVVICQQTGAIALRVPSL